MLPLDSLDRVLDSSPAAITIFTPEQQVVWASSAHARLFGRDPANLPGCDCPDLVHPDDRQAFARALDDARVDRSRRIKWDSKVLSAGGASRWVENTVAFLPDAGYVLYQHDIDARKVVELDYERRACSFTSSYARLEEFAYAAAHDLREPLRAIATCTNLLVRGANIDNESKQKADFITSGVARMSALIDDMLSFATSGIQQRSSPVDLRDAVAQAAQDLEPEMARTGAELTVGELPVVLGTQAQFVRIFENLIANALKYGGERPVRIHIAAERKGPEWVIAVKDNGCGIAPEHHQEVFEPFKRLHENGAPGTGLGLALTKKIVERLGGSIWVQSESGSGSTFLFSLSAAARDGRMARIQGA